MSRTIKFRAWLKPRWDDDYDANKMYYDIQNSYDTLGAVKPYDLMNSFDQWLDDEVAIIEQYTGLKDKNGDKEIYEYDIIDGEGNIIGNYHETPELLKDRTNLLIQGFGTKTWLTTYQEAVERGCHDA